MPVLAGVSVEHAAAVVRAAAATLAALEESGWRSIVDQPLGIDGARLAGDAVAERTEPFDPLAVLERGRVRPAVRAVGRIAFGVAPRPG